MSDCAVVAKALVAKYPFLSDTGTKPHVSDAWSSFASMFFCLLQYSWMKFISMRCFNVNCSDPDEPQPKKKKLDKTSLIKLPSTITQKLQSVMMSAMSET